MSGTKSDNIMGFVFEKSWDYENGFYLTSPPSRLAKSIAQWELYKRISLLPGAIVECGVFKGASLIRWATYREMLESQHSRKIIGFDAFGKFPAAEEAEDRKFIESFEKEAGYHGITEEELRQVFAAKGFLNYELVKGNVLETVPAYVSNNPELKIALLHIDVDVYAPTKKILEILFERVVKNGLVVLDDYPIIPGATKAVDEFLKYMGLGDNILQKLPYYRLPAFLVKS